MVTSFRISLVKNLLILYKWFKGEDVKQINQYRFN